MTIAELHRFFLMFPNAATDTRKIRPNCIFFALKGENFNGNQYASEAIEKGAAYAVIDEAEFKKNEQYILVSDVLETLQQLATFHRHHHAAKVIGLTGSNGKTTTKELVHAVLSKKYNTVATKGNLNNHIGVPLTLLSIKADTEIAVVEMGANRKKEIAFLSQIAQPDFGYITNFGKAHLEGFGGVEGVIIGKSELYNYLLKNKKPVFLNADDPIQLEKLGSYVNKYGFSTNNAHYYPIKFGGSNPFVRLEVEGFEINSQLIGPYNFTNCAAAILMGKYFNVPLEDIKTAIEHYVPENNRSQLIKKNGHTIILDAYNANPSSMKAALKNFSAMDNENKVAFLGDMFELGDAALEEHQNIVDMTMALQLETVFFIGENFAKTNAQEKSYARLDSLTKILEITSIPENCSILIKGSRGMALERLLDRL